MPMQLEGHDKDWAESKIGKTMGYKVGEKSLRGKVVDYKGNWLDGWATFVLATPTGPDDYCEVVRRLPAKI